MGGRPSPRYAGVLRLPGRCCRRVHRGHILPGVPTGPRPCTRVHRDFSPFATGPGTGRWVDPLRAALARGVRVRILTRPPEEPGGGMTDEMGEIVRGLRDLGVDRGPARRMHEKIAILDGRILWHGSLNILSHRDTQESMLHIESPSACQQLGRFVSMPMGQRGGLTLCPGEPGVPQSVEAQQYGTLAPMEYGSSARIRTAMAG